MNIIKNHFYKLTKELPESCEEFTFGKIYQAASNISLYNNMWDWHKLTENETECFEEVDIGFNEVSKRFIEKQVNSNKMEFRLFFWGYNTIILKLYLNGIYRNGVSLVGMPDKINDLLYKAYIALRREYTKIIKSTMFDYYL